MTNTMPTECPVCQSPNNGHMEVHGEDSKPKDGDLSICAYCGALSKFVVTDDSSTVVELSPEETKEAMEHPDVRKALAAIRLANETRN